MPRSANSRHDKLTGSAVHTRYKRNCRFIAATKGEVLRPCELDLQARTNLRAIGQRVPAGFREDEDRRVIQAYQYFRDYVVTGIEAPRGNNWAFLCSSGLRQPLCLSMIHVMNLGFPIWMR